MKTKTLQLSLKDPNTEMEFIINNALLVISNEINSDYINEKHYLKVRISNASSIITKMLHIGNDECMIFYSYYFNHATTERFTLVCAPIPIALGWKSFHTQLTSFLSLVSKLIVDYVRIAYKDANSEDNNKATLTIRYNLNERFPTTPFAAVKGIDYYDETAAQDIHEYILNTMRNDKDRLLVKCNISLDSGEEDPLDAEYSMLIETTVAFDNYKELRYNVSFKSPVLEAPENHYSLDSDELADCIYQIILNYQKLAGVAFKSGEIGTIKMYEQLQEGKDV